MIYYDSTWDKIINIDPVNVEIETNNLSSGFNPRTSTLFYRLGASLRIKFNYSDINYIKDWFDESLPSGDRDSQKRNIFISDKKFSGCFIKNVIMNEFYSQNPNNLIAVDINTDYVEFGEFPELIAIYRDIKIDLILK